MDYYKIMVLQILVCGSLLYLSFVSGSPHFLTSSCCTLATGSCRSTCDQISLVSLAINSDDRWRHMNKLSTFCSTQLVAFWSCLNETLHEVDKGQGFYGRPCCGIPMSQTCALVCLQAKSKEDLVHACRPSEEITFHACVDHHRAGHSCCEEATHSECHSACRELFVSTTSPTRQMSSYVANACTRDSTVLQCIRNFTQATPADNPSRSLHCCDKSADSECRMACRNILKTQTIGLEIVDNLIAAGCGMPMPHDKLWQCFLASADSMQTEAQSTSQLDNLGMDSAKLHCCFRAVSPTCQRLCIKTYSNEWEKNWEEFDKECQYQPLESALIQCLAEVDEPCELGCEGLSYCTSFNHRSVDLFRNCNAQTDKAAHYDVELWQEGIIHMPMVDIPVLDITRCFPHTWKTIACALQIKPCRNKVHTNGICRSDCIKLLSHCIDQSRLQNGQTAETLCDVLSPPGSKACLSVGPYEEEVKPMSRAMLGVTHPCKASTCSVSEVCLVNKTCLLGDSCFPYTCLPGCRMGAMSQLVVPAESYALLPRVSHGKHCHKACYCNKMGTLEHCIAMPCITKGSCNLNGHEMAHMTQYRSNCSICYCFAGELRCAKISEGENEMQNLLGYVSGSSCHCSSQFFPVCGINGLTYPSACIARCLGLKEGQFSSGSCSEVDPCDVNPCSSKKRCLPKRQVCLSMKRKCPQHICVNSNVSCHNSPPMPVCDTENKDHINPCFMLREERQLAYYGKCLPRCQKRGSVCGHNSETYTSECSARADKMIIDYRHACVRNTFNSKRNHCLEVQCPPLPSVHCTSITPPGSCCPICGAALKLIYSQKLMDKTQEAIRSSELATRLAITEILERQVKTAECDLFSYPTLDGTILVIVEPNSFQPTELQVQACVREAERLKALADQMNPTLITQLPLSSIIGSHLMEPTTSTSGCQGCVLRTVTLFFAMATLFYAYTVSSS